MTKNIASVAIVVFCAVGAGAFIGGWTGGDTQADLPAPYVLMTGEAGQPNVNSQKYIIRMNTKTGESWYLNNTLNQWLPITFPVPQGTPQPVPLTTGNF